MWLPIATCVRSFSNVKLLLLFISSDGRLVRACASEAVGAGLIQSRAKPITLKLVFTASLHDVQHYRAVRRLETSSLVVPLGKAMSGISPSWCRKQITGNS